MTQTILQRKMAMDKERAQTILSRVIEKNKKEERVIISQSNNIVPNPHNNITSKTTEFIDSLNDEQTMVKIVDEISDIATKLIKRLSEKCDIKKLTNKEFIKLIKETKEI